MTPGFSVDQSAQALRPSEDRPFLSAPQRARLKRRRKHPLVGQLVTSPEEVLRERVDKGIGEGISRRPSNGATYNRPNLHEALAHGGRDHPSSDDAAGDGGTHDVNEQMLAEQYRRGLRVSGQRSFQTQSLDFLFVGERDDVVAE